MSTKNYSEIVTKIKRFLAHPLSVKGNSNEAKRWIQNCTKHMRILNRSQHREGATVSEKQKYLTAIGKLKGLRVKLEKFINADGSSKNREKRSDRVKWCDLKSAFQNRIRTGLIVNMKHVDMTAFMEDAQALFKPRIKNALRKVNALKVNAVLAAEYSVMKNDEKIVEEKYFNTKNAVIFQSTDLKDWFESNILNPILKDMEEFEHRGSGWTLHSLVNLAININNYNPMRVGSFIELPLPIKSKQACINVKNKDDQCFKWALLSALHPVNRGDNPDRVKKYKPFENELNFDGIVFPVTLEQVPKFEKQNNVSLNVFVLEKRNGEYKPLPYHLTPLKKDKHVNLLMIQNYYVDEVSDEEQDSTSDTENSPIRYHYVWIKDLSRLVCKQLSKKKTKKHICDRCLHYFEKEEKLKSHELNCGTMHACKEELPSPMNKTLQFKKFKNKEKVPFVIYADFECLLKPVEATKNTKKKKIKTEIVQKHEAFSVGFYFKCSYDDTLSSYHGYRGLKPAEWFVQQLLQLAEDIETVFWCPLPMDKLTGKQEAEFKRSRECHVCEKSLPANEKMRDHCHLTGKYRGPAHKDCNLNYQDSQTVPVIFHNLSGYDGHLLIKEISTCFEGRVALLALNKERYISFTKHVKDSDIKFRFIDSFRFMSSSLDKLASNLEELKIVKNEFPKIGKEKMNLLKRKGVFPYEYLDKLERLDERELPAKERFHSTLNNSTVSDEDYSHAKNVWSEFGIGTLGEYSDLYLKTDVLLLADVFENFRDGCLKAYGLDPAHYYTTPGLAWDAMLKYTKIELELLTDIDMVLFIERGIRGGISQCSNRYAKANNKFTKDYKPDEVSKYLMYYDVNNLYGWAMCQHLPSGGFEWVSNLVGFNFDIPDDSPVGYILEVDLEYPKAIHDRHSDLPLCPEHKKPPGSKQEKLLTTLYSKTQYVIHYRNLKQAIRNGLKLTKIHRVLKYKQSPWLKKFIDLNSGMRKQAKNEFEKDLYKLMNNAIFGKTMENVRERVDVKLVTKWDGRYGAEALISKPNFHSSSIFSEDLVAVELKRLKVVLNKPIYVGFCVLDLSKICVYDFHYDYMIPQFKQNCKLLYTDTDSLIYEIRCPDIYEIMKRDISKFDTSDYDPENVFGMPRENKKKVGLMKDECNGRIMTEFVGLRSKMYSVRVEDKDCMKKAKGVKKTVVKSTISFNDYVGCLKNMNKQNRSQHMIRSRLHELQTVKQVRVALNPSDDKRYLLPGSTDTLPWGHYKIEESDNIVTDKK